MSWIYIEDVDERCAPPDQPLLRLSVIDDLLSVAIVMPDAKRDMAYDERAQVVVPLAAVLRALSFVDEERLTRSRHRAERASPESHNREAVSK